MNVNKIGFGIAVCGIVTSLYDHKIGVMMLVVGVVMYIIFEDKPDVKQLDKRVDNDVRCRIIDGHMVLVDSNDNVLGVAEPNRKMLGGNK